MCLLPWKLHAPLEAPAAGSSYLPPARDPEKDNAPPNGPAKLNPPAPAADPPPAAAALELAAAEPPPAAAALELAAAAPPPAAAALELADADTPNLFAVLPTWFKNPPIKPPSCAREDTQANNRGNRTNTLILH